MTQAPGVADHAAPAPTVAVPVALPPLLEHALQEVETIAATTIEPKVIAATGAGAGSAAVITPAVLWLLGDLIHQPVPAQVVALVGLGVTGACTFVGGYLARHVDRAVPHA